MLPMPRSKRQALSAPVNVRIPERDLDFLREESERSGESVQTVIRNAIKAYACIRLMPPTLERDIREIGRKSLRRAIRAEVKLASDIPPSQRRTPGRFPEEPPVEPPPPDKGVRRYA